jgi:hypothetical protein
MELTERIDGRLEALEGSVEKIWSQRRTDKREARADAEARHKEVMGAIRQVNGTVREHGERLASVETRCLLNHNGTGPSPGASGELEVPGAVTAKLDPITRLAMQAGGSAAGAIALLWLVLKIIERVLEAAQAGGVG